jgi:Kef-type K+ transport system membrane component KefB
MTQDRKTLLVAVCFVIFAVIMAGLTWFLKYMGLEFVLGFVVGVALTAGCLGIAIKEVRDLS